jgi:hypothetical protein
MSKIILPTVCRASRWKVRVQRGGDHGELPGAASGTSGPVRCEPGASTGCVGTGASPRPGRARLGWFKVGSLLDNREAETVLADESEP